MKQSSILAFCLWVYDNPEATPKELKDAFQIAQAMHKQEYIDAWMIGQKDSGYSQKELRQMAEEDYIETFKQ